MLVLSRKRDEQIVIGDEIVTITVVDIRGDKVRLGIDAPKDLDVHRREVYDAIRGSKSPPVVEASTGHVSTSGPKRKAGEHASP